MIAAVYARMLIVVLGLLVSAASASAECAWVLWVERGATVDHLYAGYTSAAECIKEIDQRERLATADRSVFAKRVGSTVLTVTDTNATFVNTSRCLPDTVDPRGPKGK
jgi:hypothetical protein